MTDSLTQKACSKCGLVKPLSEYYKRHASKDGHCAQCKACIGIVKREYRKANKERIAAVQRAYEQANKERIAAYRKANKEHKAEYNRQYREANREYLAEYDRQRYRANKKRVLGERQQYYNANKEQIAERKRKYYKANKKLHQQHTRNRAAHQQNAKGTHTFDEVWQMLEDQNGLCAYCETPLFGDFHIDHMIPLSKGGENDWTNLAVTCKRCNLSKQAKTPEEFMERLAA